MIGFPICAMVAVVSLVAMVIFGLCGNDVACDLCGTLCVIALFTALGFVIWSFGGC